MREIIRHPERHGPVREARRVSPWVLSATSFAFVIVQLDVTIVNVALPEIGQGLDANTSALQWVVDAYTLGFAAFLLSAGMMGDKFGARRIFLAGFALFAIASASCAMAPGATALNVARAAQGIGAALLVPSSLAILNVAYAHDKRMLAKAIGWWTAGGGISIAAGPVVGSLLLSGFGWRAIFWVNVPICVIGFLLTRKVVPATAVKASTRSFDVAGQVLAIIALSALVGSIIDVQSLGWCDGGVRACFLVALVAGAAFLGIEQRTPAPMLPLRLFRNAGFSCAILFGILVNFTYYGVIFVLSFYFQRVRGFSVFQAGLFFLPLTGTFVLSNVASGWMTSHAGQRVPMVIGGLIACAGYALLGMRGVSLSAGFLDMLPGLVLIPAGMGLAVPAMTTSILSSVGSARPGIATAILNMARQVGGAMGVAAFGAGIATGAAQENLVGIRVTLFSSAFLLALATMLACRCEPRRDGRSVGADASPGKTVDECFQPDIRP